MRRLGGSPVDIGFVKSASALAGLFLYPMGGYIADKQGRVRLVSIATIVYAFSFIPFAYAPNWETLAFASFFQNLVLFYAPILTVLQADSMPVGKRGQGFAVALSIPSALGVISPFIGGYLVDHMGILPAMNLIYLVGFGAGIFVAILRWFTLKETLDPRQQEKIDYRNIPKVFKDSYDSFLETMRWMPPEITGPRRHAGDAGLLHRDGLLFLGRLRDHLHRHLRDALGAQLRDPGRRQHAARDPRGEDDG